MALLGLFVIGALGFAIRAMAWRDSLYRSGVGLGASMGIVSILIHSATDFNLQIPANAATFVALCAIAVLAVTHHAPRAAHGRAGTRADGGSMRVRSTLSASP